MQLFLFANLFKVYNTKNNNTFEFSKKEDAVRKLEDMGADYFQIEDALVDLFSKKTNIAYFDNNGSFTHSE